MNFKRTKRITRMIIVAMAVVMICGVCIVSYAAAAGKIGSYCSITGACSSSGSKSYCNAYGKNLTSSSRYMTVRLNAYNTTGGLVSSDSEQEVVASNGTLTTAISEVPSSCKFEANVSVYRGQTVSTGQLEYLSITIN